MNIQALDDDGAAVAVHLTTTVHEADQSQQQRGVAGYFIRPVFKPHEVYIPLVLRALFNKMSFTNKRLRGKD